MKLPRLDSPRDYVGLFVYDFGDHVSVGYTAEEIEMLRRHALHGGGDAYLVHAVDDAGCLALRGATEIDLFTEEAILFGHATSPDATTSYERLAAVAAERPIACPVKIELGRHGGHDQPHVVAMIYKAAGGAVVSAWLLTVGFARGDAVSCGAGVLADYRRAVPQPVASAYLTCRMRFTTRDEADVLDNVRRAIQR